eukprot:TRINITY_DN7224_c0_g1_i1.p1 TRINITY_DN7224_c0_g1~~TRINITY_DN7224_c0_g1_i1.p1  ORF type:complete len:327 (+),score=38.35 TRINITY_DN7224_c0_g1_i1:231-1211(+)
MATDEAPPSSAHQTSRKRIWSMARQVSQVHGLHLADGEQPFEQNSPEERNEFEKLRELAADLPEYSASGDFWTLACLRARKYNLERALKLLSSFHQWRVKMKLLERNIHTDAKLRELIELGVVQPTGQRDRVGHYIIVLRMAKADPRKFDPDDAIRNIYAALEYLYRRYPEAQSNGVAVLVDQRGASLKNMDTAVPRLLFKALANHVPCRFGGLYAVDPPLFMRMLLPVAKLMLKRKLRERLHVLKAVDELRNYFDEDQLLDDFEGQRTYDHNAYVDCVLALQSHAPYTSNSGSSSAYSIRSDNNDEAEQCSAAKSSSCKGTTSLV